MKGVNDMVLTDKQVEILTDTIYAYGEEHQVAKAIEEMSELQKELCKYLETGAESLVESISEEMADVWIMLAQLICIFDNAKRVDKWQHDKLHRLEKLVSNE